MAEDEEIEIYTDSRIRIIVDRSEPEGYIATIDGERQLCFPRGTLRDVARANVDDGIIMLNQLLPFSVEQIGLSYEHLIAAATKAHYEDEKRINMGAEQIRR